MENWFDEIENIEAPKVSKIRSLNLNIPPSPLLSSPYQPIWDVKFKIQNMSKPKKVKRIGLSNNGQSYQGYYNGIPFDSMWELAFYLYHKEIKGSSIYRNTTESFSYTDDKFKVRRFYPDFIVSQQFYEIKGRFRPLDILKKNATIGRVVFIGPDEMKPILKEVGEKIPNWKKLYQKASHSTHYNKTKRPF